MLCVVQTPARLYPKTLHWQPDLHHRFELQLFPSHSCPFHSLPAGSKKAAWGGLG